MLRHVDKFAYKESGGLEAAYVIDPFHLRIRQGINVNLLPAAKLTCYPIADNACTDTNAGHAAGRYVLVCLKNRPDFYVLLLHELLHFFPVIVSFFAFVIIN